jgi:aryl-alcohol dehydrogenase-like predicted oxidoreductase
LKKWAKTKNATPTQISLAWLQAQKPWIVPIPGTTQMEHMKENIGADAIKFSDSELQTFNKELNEINILGERLPEYVLQFSGVEAPMKK